MNIKKAKEVLAVNKLDLSNCGLDLLPIETIKIDSFQIKNDDDYDDTKWDKTAYLIGVVEETDVSIERIHKSNYSCSSYFVINHHDYFYREFLYDALKVIEALRIINGYENEYLDETITLSV